MKQIIAYNRKKVLVSGKETLPLTIERVRALSSLIAEFKRFGIIFSTEVLEKISIDEIKEYMDEVTPILIDKLHVEFGTDFMPLFPGFPAQVKEFSVEELLGLQEKIYNKEISYDDPIFTTTVKEAEGESDSVVKEPEVFGLLTEEDFEKIPSIICSIGTALADQTKEELVWFLENHPEYSLPENIPFKETLILVIQKLGDRYVPSEITDVLRFALTTMGASEEIISVPKIIGDPCQSRWNRKRFTIKNPVYGVKSPKRSDRKLIMKMIETVISRKGLEACIVNSKRHTGHWMLVIKNLHVNDYSKKFPLAVKFAKLFSEDRKCFKSWAASIQLMYRTNSIEEISKEVAKRPGEFLRRFDSLLRRYISERKDVQGLYDILDNLKGSKNKMLVELLSYYSRRTVEIPRYIRLKGKTNKVTIPSLRPHTQGIVNEVSDKIKSLILSNIKNSVTENELEGKRVVIEPTIAEIPIPRDMRGSASIPVGTKFDIPKDVEYIRFFVHWIQEHGKFEDLDLHGCFYSENYKNSMTIGWNGGHNQPIGVYSGDVRGKDGKCAEYVDVDIKGALENGYRYVLMDVYNYQERGLNSLPCWFGYEYRKGLAKSQNLGWNPSNPIFMSKSETNSSRVSAWLFDMVERKAIFVNMPMDGEPYPSEYSFTEAVIQFAVSESVLNSYDILKAYYQSQGAEILNEVPMITSEDGEEKLDDSVEKITKDDIIADYTKVLQILGN